MMKKIYLLFAFLTSTLVSFSQTTIDFENSSNWIAGSGSITSYQGDHQYNDGIFSSTVSNGLRNGNELTDGVAGAIDNFAWRVRNVTGSYFEANIASGGVSTFSMMARRWDESPEAEYTLEYSTDGTTWTTLSTINDTHWGGASNFVQIDGTINSAVPNIKIRLTNVSGERIMVDNFIWSAFNAAGCNLSNSGIASITCNDNGTSAVPTDDYISFDLNPTGADLGTNYTVSVSSGTITPTTAAYGTATSFQLQAGSAGAGDVTVTITDDTDGTCTLDQLITDPGVCSSATPVITLTPPALTGFDHMVGTPSTEQTFSASGLSLTNDIVITAPTNFEISLTAGSGFTNTINLTPASGTVSATDIYVRGNAAAMGTISGDIIATSTGALNDTVMVSGYANDYVAYSVDEVTTVDANGVADSLGVKVWLTGIVHCMDFDGNEGLSFTLIDAGNSGINVFNYNDVSNYVVTEGDSLLVRGEIDQFNGLIQLFVDSIEVLAQGALLSTPTVVTVLDESTESQVITIENLTFVTPMTTFNSGSSNVDVTDGTNVFTMRIDSDTDIPGTAAPQVSFSVTGIGGQYDSSSPYDDGYQIFPCGLASIVPSCTSPDVSTTVSSDTIFATQVGLDYQWINCSDDSPITGANGDFYVPTADGDYAVIITDGECADTSACVNIVLGQTGLNENSFHSSVSIYPNPTNDIITISFDGQEATVSILDLAGKIVSTSSIQSNDSIAMSNLTVGTYIVRIEMNGAISTKRVVLK